MTHRDRARQLTAATVTDEDHRCIAEHLADPRVESLHGRLTAVEVEAERRDAHRVPGGAQRVAQSAQQRGWRAEPADECDVHAQPRYARSASACRVMSPCWRIPAASSPLSAPDAVSACSRRVLPLPASCNPNQFSRLTPLAR